MGQIEPRSDDRDAAPRRGWAGSESLVALRGVLARGGVVHRVTARRAGLSDHELAALERLSETPMGPGELADLLRVTRPAATGIADRLAGRGHVERRAVDDDRRRTELAVTDSGRAEARAHLMPMFLRLAELDAEFDEAEQAVVARYLRGVVEAFDAVIDSGD